MAATIQASNLTKLYPKGNERVLALHDVSLEIYPGEMVGIAGRRGSGKSTLFQILGCLERPDSGNLRIVDQDVTQLEDEELARVHAQKIGFLAQDLKLLPKETLLANAEVPIKDVGLQTWESRQKAREALRLVGLANRAEHKLAQISARESLCVAIARALVNDPAVILVDEPTRFLDSSSREEVMGLFQKLNDEGRTILIATADPGVTRYCRRAIRMADGMTGEDELVARRRIVPLSRIPGPAADMYLKGEERVCPRCNYGNSRGADLCQRCDFPIHLLKDDEEAEVARPDPIEELKRVPFFARLGSKSLTEIIPALEYRRFVKGSTIIKEGEVGDCYYLIRSGDVQVEVGRAANQIIPIARLGTKEGFGEMALMSDEPRNADVVAITDVEVWRLPKGPFKDMLSENAPLSIYFKDLVAHRQKEYQERVYPSA